MPTVRPIARPRPTPASSASRHADRPRRGIVPGLVSISRFFSRKLILAVLRIKVGVSIAVIDFHVEISICLDKLRLFRGVERQAVNLDAQRGMCNSSSTKIRARAAAVRFFMHRVRQLPASYSSGPGYVRIAETCSDSGLCPESAAASPSLDQLAAKRSRCRFPGDRVVLAMRGQKSRRAAMAP